jgi:hypothetical protein
VEAEINLAKLAKLSDALIDDILRGSTSDASLQAIIALTDATVRDRIDSSEARELVCGAYGDKGLIELFIAMNGAAMLPGVKRA